MIFAELADPISGYGGWVGAGLLGFVLAWLLLKHLPAKDEQIERMIRLRDEMVQKMVVDLRATVEKVVSHCEAEMKNTRADWEAHHSATLAALSELAREIRGRRP